jgi:large subunit ribosomal protein L13
MRKRIKKMKIIDGKNAVLGRLASYVAKESLKGEEINVINCEQIIITGNRKFIEKDFQEKRERTGSGQKGPKISRDSEKIVKRAIRGMLPDHREGRGREAFKRIKCYAGIPPEFKDSKKISFNNEDKLKYIQVKGISK